jgi:hypothetical protein
VREKYNITIYRGETFSTQVELRDASNSAISLSGATVTSSCRSKTTNEILFNFSCIITNPSSNGIFVLGLPSASSQNLTPQKNLIYDVRIMFASGDVKYWLGGDVEVKDTVTT